MKKLLTTLAILVLVNTFGACMSKGNQATIYVSVNGNDISGDGSNDNPYASLYKAVSVAGSGDVIHLKSGNYAEKNIIHLPVGVSVEGEGVNTVVFSTYINTHNYDAALILESADGTSGNQSISNFILDGSNLIAKAGIRVIGRSYVKVHDMTIRNFASIGIDFRGYTNRGKNRILATGNELYNCQIINNSDRHIPTPGSNGNIVVSGFAPKDGSDVGMRIHDNVIRQTQRAVDHNGNIFTIPAGSYSSVEGLKYYNNKSYKNQNDAQKDFSFHLELWDCQGGVEIYKNEFHGGVQQLDLAGTDTTFRSFSLRPPYTYNFYIHDNLFQMDTLLDAALPGNRFLAVGINIEAAKAHLIIERNHFKGIPFAIHHSLNHAGVLGQKDIVIRYNLFESSGFANNNYAFDYSIVGGNQSALLQDVYFYNNTIAKTRTRAACYIHLTKGDSIVNFHFMNNIITRVASSDYGWFVFSNAEGYKDSFYIRNNLVNNNANNNDILFQDGAKKPLNFIYTGTIKADPLLTSDFKPKKGSPAFRTGAQLILSRLKLGSYIGAFGDKQ